MLHSTNSAGAAPERVEAQILQKHSMPRHLSGRTEAMRTYVCALEHGNTCVGVLHPRSSKSEGSIRYKDVHVVHNIARANRARSACLVVDALLTV